MRCPVCMNYLHQCGVTRPCRPLERGDPGFVEPPTTPPQASAVVAIEGEEGKAWEALNISDQGGEL